MFAIHACFLSFIPFAPKSCSGLHICCMFVLQEVFEEMFKQHGDIMSIIYLKSFSRARVVYHNENESCQAKDKLHGCTMEGNQLGVYFTQVRVTFVVRTININEILFSRVFPFSLILHPFQIPHIPKISQTLQPPPPVKQFLISPPVSPPVNWKPITEGSPVINHDLLSAIAQLKPDEPYEAHLSTGDHPSITVHWCEDDDDEGEGTKERPMRRLPRHMVQTCKPDTKPN